MKLWVAEYHRAFTGEKRLILFHCPTNLNPSFVADELRSPDEFTHNLEDASQALGYEVRYIDISYKEKKKRKPRYGYYPVNR